ncbi:uncharacterized protein LOC143284446 [Babylonia areolata]|uniref:uncharacterized protein LOC143284446 n=1 Tax=Babylonia areolata TaxID=304850 RepID=UPI003FD466AB
MGLQNDLRLLSFLATFAGVLGGDYCYDDAFSGLRWCSYGCCGYLDTDCCDSNVALIVGLTVMGILVTGSIIAIVCCCVRRRAAAGQVIQTNPGPGLVVTTSQTTMGTAYATQGTHQPAVYGPPQAGAYGAPQPYPMGQQQPPVGAMAPPPYPGDGGQVNQGFNYRHLN